VQQFPTFDTSVVDAMASKLGLDIEEHEEFQWVVRDCLLSLRDEGWECKVGDVPVQGGEPDLKFVYKFNDECRTFHPIVDAHRRLAEGLRHTTMDLKLKRLDPHYRVKHLVWLAIMGCAPPDKDVRNVTYPSLIEEIMENLDVNPQDEPYLIHRIKVTVEDAYFRMKREGTHAITIDTSIDVDSLCVNLELDRVGFMKKIAPTGLLYCVECQTGLADVASTANHDVFCNKCAVETHSTGHRQDAQMVFIEQTVCSECQCNAALVRCQDCVDLFCRDCFASTHAAASGSGIAWVCRREPSVSSAMKERLPTSAFRPKRFSAPVAQPRFTALEPDKITHCSVSVKRLTTKSSSLTTWTNSQPSYRSM
jgi:hypothetical protein